MERMEEGIVIMIKRIRLNMIMMIKIEIMLEFNNNK
jgi:hypothetical protein